MKEICNGKINSNGICEKCYQVSQTTSGYCSRLVDVNPEEILKAFADKMSNTKDIDPEINAVLTPEFFNKLLKESNNNQTMKETREETYSKVFIKSEADFDKLFYELINAGRDMAERDRMGNVYLSEEMYLKDIKSRYLQPVTDKEAEKEVSDDRMTRKEIRSIILDKFKQFWVDKKDEYEEKDEVDITLGEKSMLNICIDYFAHRDNLSVI